MVEWETVDGAFRVRGKRIVDAVDRARVRPVVVVPLDSCESFTAPAISRARVSGEGEDV